MALIDDFKARFPEFPASVVDQYFPIIESYWQCYYGYPYEGCYKEAILNLIAHLMVMETTTGSGSIRNVTSQSVGSVSESFESASSTGGLYDLFGTSKYGQRFLFLISRSHGPRFV